MKRFQVTVNGTAYDVQVEEIVDGGAAAAAAEVAAAPAAPVPSAQVPASAPADPAPGDPEFAGVVKINAPMPGNIWEIRCSVGQPVSAGEALLVLEAMKMQNEITSPAAGTVTAIHASKGDTVEAGALLISLN